MGCGGALAPPTTSGGMPGPPVFYPWGQACTTSGGQSGAMGMDGSCEATCTTSSGSHGFLSASGSCVVGCQMVAGAPFGLPETNGWGEAKGQCSTTCITCDGKAGVYTKTGYSSVGCFPIEASGDLASNDSSTVSNSTDAVNTTPAATTATVSASSYRTANTATASNTATTSTGVSLLNTILQGQTNTVMLGGAGYPCYPDPNSSADCYTRTPLPIPTWGSRGFITTQIAAGASCSAPLLVNGASQTFNGLGDGSGGCLVQIPANGSTGSVIAKINLYPNPN